MEAVDTASSAAGTIASSHQMSSQFSRATWLRSIISTFIFRLVRRTWIPVPNRGSPHKLCHTNTLPSAAQPNNHGPFNNNMHAMKRKKCQLRLHLNNQSPTKAIYLHMYAVSLCLCLCLGPNLFTEPPPNFFPRSTHFDHVPSRSSNCR